MEIKLDIEPIENWGVKSDRPLVISGPCSAETEEQVMEAGRLLSAEGVKIFRAGIWKPRTRPNTFEGVGAEGLQWLKQVKQETGMLISTEVANVKHVYECLKNGVDIIWIGARTSANPFAVQEIADALQGVDIPVLVKNPINPDVELWIGAIERIHGAGITKLGAIHRGFSSHQKNKYRNVPMWQIPIELRRRMPNLPIICDPSHIAGKSELIHEISQKAMDLGHDGLMIESHPNPRIALSDARQQLTPKELGETINSLVMRAEKSDSKELKDSLESLRHQIDEIDHEILDVIEKRMKIVEQIGQNKKDNNIQIIQTKRWDFIIEDAIKIGASKGLSEEVVNRVFKALHQESINRQEEIYNS